MLANHRIYYINQLDPVSVALSPSRKLPYKAEQNDVVICMEAETGLDSLEEA